MTSLRITGLGPDNMSFEWNPGDGSVGVFDADDNPADQFSIPVPEGRPISSFDALEAVFRSMSYLRHHGDDDPATISMDAIVAQLTERGFLAYVEQTGGGCATIYVGPKWWDAQEECFRWCAVAGPGSFYGPGWTRGMGFRGDFYIGPDDAGESTPVEVDQQTVDEIVDLLAEVAVAEAHKHNGGRIR